jgi:hypothetical protein
MEYHIGLSKFGSKNKVKYQIMGIGGVVLFHGAYDFSLMQNNIPGLGMVGAFLSLCVAIHLSKKAMRLYNEDSPFRNKT